jgi:hypothetical protein
MGILFKQVGILNTEVGISRTAVAILRTAVGILHAEVGIDKKSNFYFFKYFQAICEIFATR